MRLFLRRTLIWSLATMLLLPTWLMTSLLGAEHAKAAAPGDVSITQYMVDPAKVSDQFGEWMELYNTSVSPIDLSSWKIQIDGGALVTIVGTCVLPVSGYAVIGPETNINSNGGVNITCPASISLSQLAGNHQISMLDENNVAIDTVSYLDTDIVPGHARYFDGFGWSNESTYTYGLGDYGAPASAPALVNTHFYPRIQMAVDASLAGDTVLVFPGSHNENLVIGKSVILQGINNPTLTSITLNSGSDLTGTNNIATSTVNLNNGSKLADALDLVLSGGAINLASGNYNGGLNITKSITLRGAADTVIDANGSAKTLAISGINPNVSLQNLTLKGTSSGIGISLESGTVSVTGSTVRDYVTGISVIGGLNHQISNSSILGNTVNLNNASGSNIGATNNWWGTADKSVIQPKVLGSVVFEPYFVNASKTLLSDVAPAKVYISPAFVDGSADGHIFGYDAFVKIQNGISAVQTGGSVNVGVGTFDEAIVVSKDVTMAGAGSNSIIRNSLPSGVAIVLSGGNLTVSDVAINGSATGIKVNAGNLSLSNSLVASNTAAGIDASASPASSIVAAKNYWGSAVGPTMTANPSGNGDKILGNVIFRPFFTDSTMTQLSSSVVDSGSINNLYQVGTLVADSGNQNSTPGVTVAEQLSVNIVSNGGTSGVQLPQGTKITKSDGSNFDATTISGLAVSSSAISGLPNGLAPAGALQWGISGSEMIFNPAVTINLFVGDNANGKILTVLRSTNGSNWTDSGIVAPGTCVVSGGICTFQTTKASYFAVVSGLTAPTIAATASVENGERFIRVDWSGTGGVVEKYQVFVNGVASDLTTISVSGNDFGKAYSLKIKVSADGKYEVFIRAINGSIFSTSATKTVEFSAPLAQVSENKASNSEPKPSIAPEKAAAQDSVRSNNESAVETPKDESSSDDKGEIKGDEEKTAEEKINWTPWIVLFVLIILTGAATGAYFYWFSGEEELENAVAPVKAKDEVKKIPSKKTEVKKTTGKKKAKRW